jgi:hypothetical protein
MAATPPNTFTVSEAEGYSGTHHRRPPRSPYVFKKMSSLAVHTGLLAYAGDTLLPAMDALHLRSTITEGALYLDVQLLWNGEVRLLICGVSPKNLNRKQWVDCGFLELKPFKFERHLGECPSSAVLGEALASVMALLGTHLAVLHRDKIPDGDVRDLLKKWMRDHP